MKNIIIAVLLCISCNLNAQVALPTFQGAQYASFALYSFSSHTFTNCGATGKTGPTLANCKSSYDTSWEDDTDFFNVQTQGIQEWTVPSTGTYTIEAYGAQGGNTGGEGARMKGTFSLTIGHILKIVVGQIGVTQSNNNGGGGGGSFVWNSSSSNTLFIAAAGGGGRAGNSNSSTGGVGSSTATTTNSANGSGNGSGGSSGAGGSGGVKNQNVSYTAAGSGGAGWSSNGSAGESATYTGTGGISPLNGGTGGTAINISGNVTPHGGFGGGGSGGGMSGSGGGGGGYNGGGGGNGWNGSTWGSAGGGGSYNSGSNTDNSSGVRESHGQIIITLID